MLRRMALLALFALVACGGSKDPVQELVRDLERYPEYSLIVDDTRVEGSVFPDYALRFQVLTAAGQRVVPGDEFAALPRDDLAGRRQDERPLRPVEQLRPQPLLEMVNALTDRGLTDPVELSRPAEAPQISYVAEDPDPLHRSRRLYIRRISWARGGNKRN